MFWLERNAEPEIRAEKSRPAQQKQQTDHRGAKTKQLAWEGAPSLPTRPKGTAHGSFSSGFGREKRLPTPSPERRPPLQSVARPPPVREGPGQHGPRQHTTSKRPAAAPPWRYTDSANAITTWEEYSPARRGIPCFCMSSSLCCNDSETLYNEFLLFFFCFFFVRLQIMACIQHSSCIIFKT